MFIKSLIIKFCNKNHLKKINIPADPGCSLIVSLIPPKN